MSMLSDIRHFLKKYLKNPVLVTAVGYMVYKILNKHTKKQEMAESVQEIDSKDGKILIHDSSTGKYVLIDGDKVYSSGSVDKLRRKMNES